MHFYKPFFHNLNLSDAVGLFPKDTCSYITVTNKQATELLM